MDAPEIKPFSKKKIVVVAAFLFLLGVAFVAFGYYLHQTGVPWSWDYWAIRFVIIGIGSTVIFGIALVQGLFIFFSRDGDK